jgi:hypothetical protein
MADIVLGLLSVLAGAAMLLAGQFVLRLVFPIWGFFVGFSFGAGLVADLADERFLGTVLGWILGLLAGIVCAVLAYFSYYVAVVIAMGGVGFAIGSGLVTALGIDWSWVAVLTGMLVGFVIGLLAIFADVPMIVLVVLSSLAGAVGVVGGIMLVFGALETADFTNPAFTDAVQDSWIWGLLLLVLAVAGILIQSRQRAMMRRSVREYWYAETRVTGPDALDRPAL